MTEKKRADLGFDDVLGDFNPSEFASKAPKNTASKTEETAAKKAALDAGFRSREVKSEAVKVTKPKSRVQRRRRTGRDTQFNMKCKQETIDAYIAIADKQDWGLGETLEYAVELLQREYQGKKV